MFCIERTLGIPATHSAKHIEATQVPGAYRAEQDGTPEPQTWPDEHGSE